MIQKLRNILERNAFGVCSQIAEALNMKASAVRLFFIYSSFITLGSPLIIYLIMAFVFRIKGLINSKRSSVFDL
jgi:phage shock protein PspC (stress-responsive transcriptional regulator)